MEEAFQKGIKHADDTPIYLAGPADALPDSVRNAPIRQITETTLPLIPLVNFISEATKKVFLAIAGWVSALTLSSYESCVDHTFDSSTGSSGSRRSARPTARNSRH